MIFRQKGINLDQCKCPNLGVYINYWGIMEMILPQPLSLRDTKNEASKA